MDEEMSWRGAICSLVVQRPRLWTCGQRQYLEKDTEWGLGATARKPLPHGLDVIDPLLPEGSRAWSSTQFFRGEPLGRYLVLAANGGSCGF